MGDAIDKASRLNEIGFAEFTSDLIQSTYRAIIDADQAQRADYRDLVAAVSKSSTEYINQTKLEVTGEEVLGFLAALPPFVDEEGNEIKAIQGGTETPIKLEANEELPALGLHQLNKQLDIGAIANGVVDVLGGIKDLADKDPKFGTSIAWLDQEKTTYDPVKFEELPTLTDERWKLQESDATSHLGKLYDAVAKRIAANKYTLLKDLINGAVGPLEIKSGLLETALTFQTWEREYQTLSSYEREEELVKNKLKTTTRSRGGLFGFLRARDKTRSKSKQKETEIRVRTVNENQGSSSGTSVTVLGRVVLNFATSSRPLA